MSVFCLQNYVLRLMCELFLEHQPLCDLCVAFKKKKILKKKRFNFCLVNVFKP